MNVVLTFCLFAFLAPLIGNSPTNPRITLQLPVLFPELTQQATLAVHTFFRSIGRYAYPLGAALNADLTQQLSVFGHIVRHPLVGSAVQDTPAFF